MARRAAERLRSLQQEADRLASESRTLVGDLRKLEVQRQIAEEQFRQADAEAAAAAAELDALDRDVRRLEAEDLAERPEIQARMVDLYKLGQGRYLRLLLSTADARQMAQAARMVAALAQHDRDRIAAHQKRLEELRASRGAIAERSKRLAALRAEAERMQAAAARAVAQRNALIADIDRQRDLNAQLAGELQLAQQRLQAVLLSGSAPETAPSSLPLQPFRGELDWPVDGALRTRFGASTATANGIEIAAVEGAPVAAIHDGTVAFAGTFAGFGNLVIVDHGAQNFSLYGNLLETGVSGGGRVDRGQRIGTAGRSLTGGPGLYFELRVDGKAVDPLPWLRRR
jgi:septal ring factor EnvC (AmiA/AmiB activator)